MLKKAETGAFPSPGSTKNLPTTDIRIAQDDFSELVCIVSIRAIVWHKQIDCLCVVCFSSILFKC